MNDIRYMMAQLVCLSYERNDPSSSQSTLISCSHPTPIHNCDKLYFWNTRMFEFIVGWKSPVVDLLLSRDWRIERDTLHASCLVYMYGVLLYTPWACLCDVISIRSSVSHCLGRGSLSCRVVAACYVYHVEYGVTFCLNACTSICADFFAVSQVRDVLCYDTPCRLLYFMEMAQFGKPPQTAISTRAKGRLRLQGTFSLSFHKGSSRESSVLLLRSQSQ